MTHHDQAALQPRSSKFEQGTFIFPEMCTLKLPEQLHFSVLFTKIVQGLVWNECMLESTMW